MKQQKILTGALFFLAGVMLYQAWMDYKNPKVVNPATTVQQQQPSSEISADVPATNEQASEVSESFQDEVGEAIEFETDVFVGQIALDGGNLVALGLKEYPVTVADPNQYLYILDSGNSTFHIQNGITSKQDAPNHKTPLTAEKNFYSMIGDTLEIPLSWSSDGKVFTKTYIFKKSSYLIDLELSLENTGEQTFSGNFYAQLLRQNPQSGGNFFDA